MNDLTDSQSDDFSSEYIDMEKLDDEKMAELLEDHEALLQTDNHSLEDPKDNSNSDQDSKVLMLSLVKVKTKKPQDSKI